MKQKVYLAPFYMVSAALVGLGDVFYLAYYQYMNLIPSCAIGGCEKVLTSVYSKFVGVPLSYIGIVYYMYMLCLVALLAYEPQSKALRLAVLGYTGVGFVLSFIFIFYIQLTLIGALCIYCAISAITSTTLFCLAAWHYRSTRTI